MFLGRVVGPGDPAWLPADRDKALWWQVHERERCESCGIRPAEFDPKRGGGLHAFEAVDVHCRGCEIRAQGEDWFDKHKKELRRGTSMLLRPTR